MNKQMTLPEIDVVYQLLHSTPKLWEPDAGERRIINRFVRKGLLEPRARKFPFVTEALFKQFRERVSQMRRNNRPLPDNDQVVISVIRTEPEYNFAFGERRMANRLARGHMIRPAKIPGRFLLTALGYISYSWDPIERSTLH